MKILKNINPIFKNEYLKIITKAREQNIKNFSDQELNRVFKNCVSPSACKRGLKKLIVEGLTIDMIYNTDY